MCKKLKIAVVGNCAAGKTTLVTSLKNQGFINSYNVPQEHSIVPKLWKRYNPDILVYLTCSLEQAKKRRPRITWGQERLDNQRKKLIHAYEHKDIFIDTNNLSKQEVLRKVIAEIEKGGRVMVTLEQVKEHPITKTFIKKGDEHLGAMGFTEHSFRHKNLVSNIAANVLERLGYSEREVELAAIAGYLHDIGNVISRYNHGQTGAMIAYDILKDLEMDIEEIAIVIAAIGNHEEQYGESVNNVAAALILADKSDVHRSRVRNTDLSTFDIHDRVNYGAVHSFLNVEPEKRKVTLELEIDKNITTVMEYFEIFLSRMIMCRRAAEFLDASFGLVINDAKLL